MYCYRSDGYSDFRGEKRPKYSKGIPSTSLFRTSLCVGTFCSWGRSMNPGNRKTFSCPLAPWWRKLLGHQAPPGPSFAAQRQHISARQFWVKRGRSFLYLKGGGGLTEQAGLTSMGLKYNQLSLDCGSSNYLRTWRTRTIPIFIWSVLYYIKRNVPSTTVTV